jgi:hypothetical protein
MTGSSDRSVRDGLIQTPPTARRRRARASRDLGLHHVDAILDRGVLLVGAALERDRLAEVEVVLHGQRQQAERTEPRERRRDRKRGHAEQAREAREVGEAGLLVLGADDADGHDRRARREREPHEAEPEAHQLVAVAIELVHAAHAFGKRRDALAVLEHLRAVVRRADHRAAARGCERDERQPWDPVLAHAARDARRLGFEQQRGLQHHRVERQLACVVRDHEHASGRHAVDVVRLDAEVVAVEQHARQRHRPHPLGRQTERVEAILVEPVRHLAQPLVELGPQLAQRDGHARDEVRDRAHRATLWKISASSNRQRKLVASTKRSPATVTGYLR